MKTPDFNSLVTGILTVIGIAIACGQYGKLETWARHQAGEALAWKQGLPYFFAPGGGAHHGRHPGGIDGNPYMRPVVHHRSNE